MILKLFFVIGVMICGEVFFAIGAVVSFEKEMYGYTLLLLANFTFIFFLMCGSKWAWKIFVQIYDEHLLEEGSEGK